MENLKTNYKNDIFTGLRKYNQTNNADGSISLTDITSYSQEADAFGASDINTTNTRINNISNDVEVVFPLSLTWTQSSVNSTVYATVTNANIIEGKPIGFVKKDYLTMTDDELEALHEIYVVGGNANAGSLTLSLSEVPEVEFTYILKGV